MAYRRCVTCLKFKLDERFMQGRDKCNRCHMLQRSRPRGEAGAALWPYPIPPAVKRALRIKQEGRCALCGDRRERLYVDHDHRTGAVRALVCAPCNAGLGFFRDDIHRLRQAIAYLQRRPASGDPWAQAHQADDHLRLAQQAAAQRTPPA